MQNKVLLLDCTLRDGGYYTNWDFDESLVNDYFESMNHLPADFLEIGYRSIPKKEYAGAFFYLPVPVLEKCKKLSAKKLAIILNEKEVDKNDLSILLEPCKDIISLVRIAVQPNNFERAVILAAEVKKMGFLTAFNLMYASTWKNDFELGDDLKKLNDVADYFYVVDSYGGLFPQDVKEIFQKLKNYLNIPLGYHGHDNLEMALANSLAAIQAGAQIIDSTVCGMGRGAGNLKSELFYTILHQQNNLDVNFDFLNTITASFEALKKTYKWGTNLPYMVSGAFSLPQNKVLNQVKKRYYSINSIIKEETGNKAEDVPLNNNFPQFEALSNTTAAQAILVGGGESPRLFAKWLLIFLNANPNIAVLFSSSRNASVFNEINNPQIHFLPGMEARRLEKSVPNIKLKNRLFVVPGQTMAKTAYLPQQFEGKVSSFNKFEINDKEVSSTAVCIKIAELMGVEKMYMTGYDGYEKEVSKQQLELFEENQNIFNKLKNSPIKLVAVTPTQYNVNSESIFSII